jgi:hypothetical protein
MDGFFMFTVAVGVPVGIMALVGFALWGILHED